LRFKASLGKKFSRPYLEKPNTKKGLVKWLKVQTLVPKKKKERRKDKETRPLKTNNYCSHLHKRTKIPPSCHPIHKQLLLSPFL
jgi:hypothetical protein